ARYGAHTPTNTSSASQTITSTTSGCASATSPITARVLTLLTFAATDVAGNRETIRSESIVVGSGDDRLGWACAGPTPSFAMPTHGTLVVSGTVAVNGITSTFSKTIAF